MVSVKTFSPKIKIMSSSFIKKFYIFDIFYHFPQFEQSKSEKILCAWGVKDTCSWRISFGPNFGILSVMLRGNRESGSRDNRLSDEVSDSGPSIFDETFIDQGEDSDDTSMETDQTSIFNCYLDAKVYKIYCQHEDPNKARKAIKNMVNFGSFKGPSAPMPKDENLARGFQKFLSCVWPLGPPNLEQIKAFIEAGISLGNHFTNKMNQIKIPIDEDENEMITFDRLLMKSFTTIVCLQPNGYDVWLIKDFEKGPEVSKWYRGVACDIFAAIQVARLSVMRVQVPKSEKKVKWFDFGVEYFDKRPTPGIVCHSSEQ